MSKNLDEFAEIIISKLRDENYTQYLSFKEKAEMFSVEEVFGEKINKEIWKDEIERFRFLQSLNGSQKKALDKLVLNILDSTAFNFLREIDENLSEDKGIGIVINGSKIEAYIHELIGNGFLFGEYFIWCEQKSKFGKFQE